jgi:PKD domain-containing protein
MADDVGSRRDAGRLGRRLGVSAVAASSASAILKRLPNGQVVSYQPLRNASPQVTPFDTTFNNMDYTGGPVMPSNTDYMVLWSPSGLSAYPPEYVQGIAQYFKDLAHDSGGNQNVDSIATQCNDLTGAFVNYDVRFGGVVLDTNPYPPSECPHAAPVTQCLTDPQIQQELVNVVTAHHLPTDLSHEYFLLTPPHVESCFSNNQAAGFDGCSAGEPKDRAFCAYHQNTALQTMLFYANDPFEAGIWDDPNHPNGISDAAISGGLSHEHNESITDPIPNDAWTNGAGADQGEEVGDQCVRQNGTPLGTAPNGALYNQVINGHFYYYQEEWSNLGHSCMQRLNVPRHLPTANEAVTAGQGTDMTFDASRSRAPGGVAQFSWQFNAVPDAQTVEQQAPTITYTFPAPGAYSTGVTVLNADGLSAGTGGIVVTGKNGFEPAFTVSQGDRGQGRTVRFSALTTVSGEPVMTYLWEFGDGTTGSGATPTHTYQRSGTYTVTTVLFSGTGSAFPGQGAGPIYQQTIRVHNGHQ